MKLPPFTLPQNFNDIKSTLLMMDENTTVVIHSIHISTAAVNQNVFF